MAPVVPNGSRLKISAVFLKFVVYRDLYLDQGERHDPDQNHKLQRQQNRWEIIG